MKQWNARMGLFVFHKDGQPIGYRTLHKHWNGVQARSGLAGRCTAGYSLGWASVRR